MVEPEFKVVSFKERQKKKLEATASDSFPGVAAGKLLEQKVLQPSGSNVSLPAEYGTPENGQQKDVDASGMSNGEDEKGKSHQSFFSEDLVKKAKLKLGAEVIFILLNEAKNKFPDYLYTIAKRKVLQEIRQRKQQGESGPDDEAIEDLIRKKVQDLHKAALQEQENTWNDKCAELNKQLGATLENYRILKSKADKDGGISKTKEELCQEINELTTENKKNASTIKQLHDDIKVQNNKFQENESKLLATIKQLEDEIASTQAEEFKKLKSDNKRLIAENERYIGENKKLNKNCEKMKENVEKITNEAELMKNELIKELDNVQKLKSQLELDSNKIEAERKELEKKKQELAKISASQMEVTEIKKKKSFKTGHVDSPLNDIIQANTNKLIEIPSRDKKMLVANGADLAPAAKEEDKASNSIPEDPGEEQQREKKKKKKASSKKVNEMELAEEEEKAAGGLGIMDLKLIKSTLESYKSGKRKKGKSGGSEEDEGN